MKFIQFKSVEMFVFDVLSYFKFLGNRIDRRTNDMFTYFLAVVSDLIVSFETLCSTLKKLI